MVPGAAPYCAGTASVLHRPLFEPGAGFVSVNSLRVYSHLFTLASLLFFTVRSNTASSANASKRKLSAPNYTDKTATNSNGDNRNRLNVALRQGLCAGPRGRSAVADRRATAPIGLWRIQSSEPRRPRSASCQRRPSRDVRPAQPQALTGTPACPPRPKMGCQS